MRRALLARGTRGLRRPSFDARSRGLLLPASLGGCKRQKLKDGRAMQARESGGQLPCSQTAHDQNVLGRCAQ
jgi:hypothetical protein